MVIMAMTRKSSIFVVFLLLLCPTLAFTGDWQFDPSVKFNETFSDNVNLSSNNEESSWVSQAGILFDTTYHAQYADFSFSSESLYATYSHDHNLDDSYHTLDSNFNIQLWPNGISLIGSASIANQSRNSSRNALADIVSADTIRVESYLGGLAYNVNNSDFIINSSITYNTTTFEDNIGNRDGITAQLITRNGNSHRNVFWDIRHNYRELKNNGRDGEISQSEIKLGLITNYKFSPFIRYYDENNSGNTNNLGQSTESNSYGAGLRWLITPKLTLDTSFNKPVDSALDINNNRQNDYVNTAVSWQPSIRTSLQVSISERFYGNSYELDFLHRNKRLTNTINYTEEVQTLTRDNFVPVIIGNFWCPILAPVNSIADCRLANDTTIVPDDYQLTTISDIVLAEDDALSLNKSLNWQTILNLPRTILTFSASAQIRENLDTRIEDENNNVSFNIERKLSPRSSLNIRASYTRTNYQLDTALERSDGYRRYQLAYEKSLNSMLTFNIEITYLNRNSSNFTLKYKESRVSANITKGF